MRGPRYDPPPCPAAVKAEFNQHCDHRKDVPPLLDPVTYGASRLRDWAWKYNEAHRYLQQHYCRYRSIAYIIVCCRCGREVEQPK